MSNLDYEKIQTLQENVTKKLINFINDFIKDDRSLDSIEFHYPNFDERKAKLAFNVWLSIDYRTNTGKSFIELMLEEETMQLSNLEKEILIERNKSFVSLFEIEKIDGEFIHAKDILTGKEHTLWEPISSKILNVKDLIFARISKIIDFKGFIGNISFLPRSIKAEFMADIFISYNRARFKDPYLTIDRYLKQYSIDIYRTYTECIYDAIDMGLDDDDDITSVLYDELDEFEYYLHSSLSRSEIKKHVTNLINLFEHYFIEEEFSLQDISQLDIEKLFSDAIDDGLISSQKELSSYISTLKIYLRYLKNMDPTYKESYEKILEISKNRFLYIDNTRNLKSYFKINRTLSNSIAQTINEKAFDFIMDYEKFLLYLMSTPLELTKQRKNIKRKSLLEYNKIMENRQKIAKKAPNQEDFPILNFFYHFSLSNELCEINGYTMSITKKGAQFLKLTDEEKYSLFIQYILSDEFILNIYSDSDINKMKSVRESFLNLFKDLREGTVYKYNSFSFANTSHHGYIIGYLKHLKLMGILEYSYYPTLNFILKPFGKTIFSVIANKDSLHDNGKVIYLNQ